jgi:hypothetical protein
MVNKRQTNERSARNFSERILDPEGVGGLRTKGNLNGCEKASVRFVNNSIFRQNQTVNQTKTGGT